MQYNFAAPAEAFGEVDIHGCGFADLSPWVASGYPPPGKGVEVNVASAFAEMDSGLVFDLRGMRGLPAGSDALDSSAHDLATLLPCLAGGALEGIAPAACEEPRWHGLLDEPRGFDAQNWAQHRLAEHLHEQQQQQKGQRERQRQLQQQMCTPSTQAEQLRQVLHDMSWLPREEERLQALSDDAFWPPPPPLPPPEHRRQVSNDYLRPWEEQPRPHPPQALPQQHHQQPAAPKPLAGPHVVALESRQPEGSVGSVAHTLGECKPCAWFWRPQGCSNGFECRHCHLCPSGEVRARRKHKVSMSRRRQSTLPAATMMMQQDRPPF